jgi:hypothetical protein
MGLLDRFNAQKRAEAAAVKVARARLQPLIENRIRFKNDGAIGAWHKQKGVVFERDTTPQGTVTYLKFTDPKLGKMRVRAAAVSGRYSEQFVDVVLAQGDVRARAAQATKLAGDMKTAAISMADSATPERLAQIKQALALRGNTPFPSGWEGMMAFLQMIGTAKSNMVNLDFVETHGQGFFGVRVARCLESPAATQALLVKLGADIKSRTGRAPSFAYSDNMLPGSPILIRDRSFVDVTLVFPEACVLPRSNKPVPIPIGARIRSFVRLGPPIAQVASATGYYAFKKRMASLSDGRDWGTVLSMKARDMATRAAEAQRLRTAPADVGWNAPAPGLEVKAPMLAPRPTLSFEPELTGPGADELELRPRF